MKKYVVQSRVTGSLGISKVIDDGTAKDVQCDINLIDDKGATTTLAVKSAYGHNGRPTHTNIDVVIEAESLDEAWTLGSHYAAYLAVCLSLTANAGFYPVSTDGLEQSHSL